MSKKATRQAYGEALAELGAKNPRVVVLDADLTKSTKTNIFQKAFPERHFNMGISEADMMGTAAGLATCGNVVFASTFAIFGAGRAFEQVRNTIAYPALNVKVAVTHAGISVGEDGGSHQSVEDIALMRAIPNMAVLVPADAVETRQMILAAAEYPGPMYIRMGRLDVETIFDEGTYEFRLGKANVLTEGKDAAVVSTGLMTQEALKAQKILAEENIHIRVLHMGTIKPLDKEALLAAARETKFVVTAEEHSVIGGLGGAVAEFLSEALPTKVIRIGINDEFGQSGGAWELLEKYGLCAENIVKTVKENM
ncbi:MAG: transketolase family protein [Fusobacteriaceae bacterium]|jgi:transketolase|nr:transketolase family protein [Fusobacteriaceae bacterium]